MPVCFPRRCANSPHHGHTRTHLRGTTNLIPTNQSVAAMLWGELSPPKGPFLMCGSAHDVGLSSRTMLLSTTWLGTMSTFGVGPCSVPRFLLHICRSSLSCWDSAPWAKASHSLYGCGGSVLSNVIMSSRWRKSMYASPLAPCGTP